MKALNQFIYLFLLSIFLTACGGGGSSSGGGANNAEEPIIGEPLTITINPAALKQAPAKQPTLTVAEVSDGDTVTLHSKSTGVINDNGGGIYLYYDKDTDVDLSDVLIHLSTTQGSITLVGGFYCDMALSSNDAVFGIPLYKGPEGSNCIFTIVGDNRRYIDAAAEPQDFTLVVTTLNRETLGMSKDEYVIQLDSTFWYDYETTTYDNEGNEIERKSSYAPDNYSPQYIVNFKKGYLRTTDGEKHPFIAADDDSKTFTVEVRTTSEYNDSQTKREREHIYTYDLTIDEDTAKITGTVYYTAFSTEISTRTGQELTRIIEAEIRDKEAKPLNLSDNLNKVLF